MRGNDVARQFAGVFMTIIMVSAVALVDDRQHVLVQQRPTGGSMAGLWEFPGGKIEHGETPQHALVREIKEELGVEIGANALVPLSFASEPLPGGNPDKHLLLLLFLCRTWTGAPTALHASELRWVDMEDLRTLPMPPADVPLIDALERVLRR